MENVMGYEGDDAHGANADAPEWWLILVEAAKAGFVAGRVRAAIVASELGREMLLRDAILNAARDASFAIDYPWRGSPLQYRISRVYRAAFAMGWDNFRSDHLDPDCFDAERLVGDSL